MSVYVDNMKASYGRMIMCHMIADSRPELDEMADIIGVNRKWIQKEGTYAEHYDICKAKRTKALRSGAIELNRRQFVIKLLAKKNDSAIAILSSFR